MGRNPWLFWMATGDLVLSFGAYILAFLIRLGGFPEPNWNAFVKLIPILLTSTLVLLVLYNQYRDLHRPFFEVAAGGFLVATGVALVVGVSAYLQLGARPFPRSILLLGALLQALILPIWRIPFVREARRRYFERPAIVITNRPDSPTNIPNYIRVEKKCTAREFLIRADRFRDHLVVVEGDIPPQDRALLLEWAASSAKDLHFFPSLYDVMISSGHLSKLGDRPVLTIRQLEVPPEFRWIKRTIDLLVASILIILFAPAWLLIPVAIFLDSGRPIFFVQQRVGENGRLFRLIKFRSMVVNAEEETGPVLSHTNDPRVTRVGRFLRATRLDELPQLFNVLKGDMSLVGPRPERPELVAKYSAENPKFRLRELVKPGLTGLAQVMGRYATSPEDKLRYDLLYIARYSPWLDLLILLWTVQIVLFPQSWTDRMPSWIEELKLGIENRQRQAL